VSNARAGLVGWLQALAGDAPPLEGSDADLIRKGKKGDRNAFARLVHRYQDRAFTLARRLTGDPAQAEDLAQEAFLRVYRSLDRFDESRPFLPWLTTILRNLVRNLARKTLPMPVEVGGEGLDPQDSRAPAPPERAARAERKARVEAEVARLPAKFREVVALRYLEDRPVRQVASLLGIPEGTVKTHLYRAREILRRRLRAWRGEVEA